MRTQCRNPAGGFGRGLGFTHHDDVALALEEIANPAADHLVVVEQVDPDLLVRGRCVTHVANVSPRAGPSTLDTCRQTEAMSPSARVLLVEDDPQLATMLVDLLTEEGYDVDLASDGQRGLHRGLTASHDLLVLDRGLPALEGLDLLGRLRRSGVRAPALVLSALANPADRVEGLDAGAEDYLGKPFDIDELLARLRALLRRSADTADVLDVPGGRFDRTTRSVRRADGTDIALTEREAALVDVLARHPDRVFSRASLLNLVFDGAGEDNLVDTYVHYVRRKLGRTSVTTVRGLGYRLGRP